MLIVLFVLVLVFESSWQEEVTEISLADMLDQIIDETATVSKENKNNSRIIYIKHDNATRRDNSGLNTDYSIESEDLELIANQIEKSKLNSILNSDETENDSTIQKDKNNDMETANDKTPVSGRRTNKVVVLSSDTESNIIHKYPEIIIDKISYDVADNAAPKVETTIRHSNAKYMTKEEKNEVAAKTLDSLVKIIMRETQKGKKLHASIEKELDDNLQRPTHIHNAYHNHVINNVPIPYSGLLAGAKMSLGELPEGYRNLHSIVTDPRNAYINPNLQLNPLMGIQTAYNRERVRFIPNTLNILPRIVYGFRRKYTG